MDIKAPIVAAAKGLYDSFRGTLAVIYMDKELKQRRLLNLTPSNSPNRQRRSQSREVTPNSKQKRKETTVVSRIVYCGLLNGLLFLCSILFFEYIFLPLVKLVILCLFARDSSGGLKFWYWLEMLLEYTFQSIWVVPLFTISKVVNNLWFQDIGQSAFKYKSVRPSSSSLPISKTIADFCLSSIIEALFLVQAMLMTYLPICHLFGYTLYIIHLSLLYSLYAFEYKWSEMGLELHKRLACIETNWPYFIGFGLPLAAFTQLSDSMVISGCIFSILFPFFIISANEAQPTYTDCYPVQLFSPVIALANAAFTRILSSTVQRSSATSARVRQPQMRR